MESSRGQAAVCLDSGAGAVVSINLRRSDETGHAAAVWRIEDHGNSAFSGWDGDFGGDRSTVRFSFVFSKAAAEEAVTLVHVRASSPATVLLEKAAHGAVSEDPVVLERASLVAGRSVVLSASSSVSRPSSTPFRVTLLGEGGSGSSPDLSWISLDLVWLRADDLGSRVALLEGWILHPIVSL